MPFADVLRPELVRIAPPWRTFDETVDGLVAALAAAGDVPAAARSAAVAAVVARESEASTALLDVRAGVPHARLAGLAAPAVALAVSRAGLYEAVPTVRIQIVALVLSPPQETGRHLDILAGISTTLRSAAVRAALLGAADGIAALAALRGR